MHLTQQTDYSLRIIIYLALNEERKVRISEISNSYKISKNHLVKLVNKLSNLGFIKTVPGVNGGISLGDRGSNLTIAEVVLAMEPNFFIAECFNPEGNCVITPVCKLQNILNTAMNSFLSELNSYTFKDLIKNPKSYKKILSSIN